MSADSAGSRKEPHRTADRERRGGLWFVLACAALSVVCIASFASPSSEGVWFGYSAATLVAHLGFLVLLGGAVWAWLRKSVPGQWVVLLGLIAVSAALGARAALYDFPGLIPILLLGRILAVIAMGIAALKLARKERLFLSRGALAACTVLATWVCVDWTIFAWTLVNPPDRFHPLGQGLPPHRVQNQFRESFEAAAVAPNDIVLVGDSFVWGVGVEATETMGSQLDAMLPGARVHSSGAPGQDIAYHTESVKLVSLDNKPARIVLVFYHNDLPSLQSEAGLHPQFDSYARTSPGLLLLNYAVRKIRVGSVEDYHAQRVFDADPASPSFDERWRVLSGQMREFFAAARDRSTGQPVFVILPLMMEYGDYPLAEAHKRLQLAASGMGYFVIDLLPVFKGELGDGTIHRAEPGDSHCDAETHALIARTLYTQLQTNGG